MSSLAEKLEQTQAGLLHRFQKIIQADRLSHAYLFAGSPQTLDMALYLDRKSVV